ncbi:MAG TPA: glycosyl hydrolase [Paludibacter sp.]|nr:glycosyl hydrolase [Paludibacter sp.]
MKNRGILFFSIILCLNIFWALNLNAQIVNVGSGSYTKTFPGTDVAGRNGYPSGSPQVSGAAVGKPAPTNDWWSTLLKENHAGNLFNYPYTMKTMNDGLVVSYIPQGVIDDQLPVVVGVTGMAATKTTVSDFSDWTVTMNWNDGTHNFETITGIAMPFLYFTKGNADVAQVKVNLGTVVIDNEMLVITNARNGADFAVYAPVGSTWTQNGSVYTSTLNGKNYWSMAFIPLTATNVSAVATEYKKYAYVFPTNTTSAFSFNETTSVVRTDFTVQTVVKEGTETNMLLGLLPHQWANLASNSPVPDKYSYATIRGQMKTMAGNSFSVENKFKGILPTLPYVDNYSAGFTPTALTEKITSMENDVLELWTDSYNEGQVMNRLIQTARIAAETGNTVALNKMVATVKERLEDWLKAEGGEKAFLFYYNTTWSALLGYPAGHGQDTNLNDHHFHWGYFIHAAAFLEQYQPGWAAQYGEMINLLVRDASSTDRNDTMFPYLRNFSPYAGHCWANGFATFPQGNDQESTSESMQFNSSLIHWGQVTGNKAVRDLGIYLYTTEQTAIEEYWMDIHHRNFPASQQYSLVSRIWGNSFDNGTFWTADIAASYGIEMYPIHGGSLYLGHDTVYVKRLWEEIKAKTGIMNNQVNPNLWHDIMWEYQAFLEPAEAIKLYDSNPNRSLKFGVSDAQTYHWLHSMNALGRVDASITANYPIAAAFKQGNKITYVAHNYSNAPITVHFSTGYDLVVPARKMITSIDSKANGTLTSSFDQAFIGGSVKLNLNITEGTPTKVEFMDGNTSLGIVNAAPYVFQATNLGLGVHSFYAKVFENEKFNTSNNVNVTVGNQLPYSGTPSEIPGTIEAGNYDIFEGGKGQNIAYLDLSPGNAGDFRMDESVDAASVTSEGATVGWINAGEWLEYTVNVAQSGLYSFAFRYASGNANGGGPFRLELDGQSISENIAVPSTSTTVWTVWATKTVNDIPLRAGKHVLRVAFSAGEFNYGKMTFARTGDLPFSYPTANAGTDIKVLLPLTSTTLNASASTESAGKALTYKWTQNYGPSVIQFTSTTTAKPSISGLVEGMYSLKLTVTNPDSRTDIDELLVNVSSSANIQPTVALTSPANNSTFTQGKLITLTANASDFDGTISKVDFYHGTTLIGSDNTAPYSFDWNPGIGDFVLTAKATDNGNAVSTSQPVNVTIAPLMLCSTTSTAASQGSFTTGYIATFETVGTNVTITFELLDDKAGVVAYLWKQTPFSESAMTNVGGKTFSTTISGQVAGSTIAYACKFAFSGGMSVTKYMTYEVGTNCGTIINDTQAPTLFSATKGAVGSNSVELLLNATDNSGAVIYTITYGSTTLTVNGVSGVAKSYLISGLSSSTAYNFTITAKDASGNLAANNPLTVSATTLTAALSLPTIDFETVGQNWSWTLFENGSNAASLYSVVPNPVVTGINNSANCAKYTVNANGAPWAGLWSANIGTFTFNADNCKIKMMVNKNVISNFDLKFENDNASVAFEKMVPNTLLNQWEELTFDFTQHIGKTVSKIVIIPDFPATRTAGSVNYWDNISFKITTGIADNKFDKTATLFPNPVRDELKISSEQNINQVIVRNLIGQIAIISDLNSNEGSINLSQFTSGNYFVTIKFVNGQIENHKIIKL